MALGPVKMGMAATLVGLIVLPAQARDLVVGVEDIDFLPVYGVRDGQFQGAARQILDAFATARGYRLTYSPLPVKRLFAELNRGGIDLKFPDSPNWQPTLRQGHQAAFSKPLVAYIDGTIVRRDMAAANSGAVRRLGTIAGFTPYAWGTQLTAGTVELKENSSLEQLLRQVRTGPM
jgi:polar amino acid transport system substrate-binding protein